MYLFSSYLLFFKGIHFSRFAFVTFDKESDCAEALKAHTQIGGEKVNVNYAFAQTAKPQQQQKPNNESNKKQEQKSDNTNKKQEKTPNKEKHKSGLYISIINFIFI